VLRSMMVPAVEGLVRLNGCMCYEHPRYQARRRDRRGACTSSRGPDPSTPVWFSTNRSRAWRRSTYVRSSTACVKASWRAFRRS
jgi:hypothetical protein